ncbi:MAG: hypothetical protein JXA91_06250 [Candidatus Thermoplasmatota archaeon]|nr:hypothetical protein [Candidatus Thermoplasmatota archaeon]
MEKTNQDGDALGAKSHSEIVELLHDLKELESNIKEFEVKEDVLDIQHELGIEEFNEPEISKQFPIEQSLPIVPLPEIPEELLETETIEEKMKQFLSEKFSPKLHLGKVKEFLKKKGLKIPERDSLLPRATFTLKINEKGKLVGFNIPNAEKENLIKHLISIIKNKTKQPSEDETAPKGVLGRIKGIFTRIIPKKQEGENESIISGLVGKIKGILPGK